MNEPRHNTIVIPPRAARADDFTIVEYRPVHAHGRDGLQTADKKAGASADFLDYLSAQIDVTARRTNRHMAALVVHHRRRRLVERSGGDYFKKTIEPREHAMVTEDDLAAIAE